MFPTAIRAIFFFSLLVGSLVFAEEGSARLLFVGDVMGHESQLRGALQADRESYDFTQEFQLIAPFVRDADCAIANLEVTLPGKPPYRGYPAFRSPDAVAEGLKAAGFDVLLTANNHTNDASEAGMVKTIDTLDRLELLHVGSYRNEAERFEQTPLWLETNGLRIAVLNYTYGVNWGLPKPPVLVNVIDRDLMAQHLAVAQTEGADFVIVTLHWGEEYQPLPKTEQEDLAKFLLARGADCIIGAHPHVIQPIREEEVTLADGSVKKGYVAYSLGNFLSSQTQKDTQLGLMLQMDVRKEPFAMHAHVEQMGLVPIWMQRMRENNKTHIVAMPIFEGKPLLKKVKARLGLPATPLPIRFGREAFSDGIPSSLTP